MPQCQKCKKFLPPGFVHTEHPKTNEPLKGALCIFCIEDKNVITYDNNRKKVTKEEILKEYDIFIKKVKENNDLLKEGAKGNLVKGMERIIY